MKPGRACQCPPFHHLHSRANPPPLAPAGRGLPRRRRPFLPAAAAGPEQGSPSVAWAVDSQGEQCIRACALGAVQPEAVGPPRQVRAVPVLVALLHVQDAGPPGLLVGSVSQLEAHGCGHRTGAQPT